MAIECCLFSLFLFPYLPITSEGELFFMADTGIMLSAEEKIARKKTKEAIESQPGGNPALTPEQRLAYLENMLPSEVVLSVLGNIYIEKATCVWTKIDDIFSFIQKNPFCKAKIPEISILKEELQKLHKLDLIRYLQNNHQYVIAQPCVKELLEAAQIIRC
jgi:hypothetical protein